MGFLSILIIIFKVENKLVRFTVSTSKKFILSLSCFGFEVILLADHPEMQETNVSIQFSKLTF